MTGYQIRVEDIVSALRAHIEVLERIVELQIEFLEKHGDVITILSNVRNLEKYVSNLNDEDASLLFRALLAYNRAILDIASMGVTLNVSTLAELRDRLAEVSGELLDLLSKRRKE
ncbi:hypothetical protein Pyrfu_0586 [Pyrolobus fumarii 1A]|uniref:Uncharacterized protein n=1 Tax=Pyrolobus fumarii (strain DSM 11204 / 1A) TaxID=694429 RepID=G0EH06_PYRF1|nr:hypothetical protein [Pyrolobus fumarii]AEM38456.1 hypothetical protein Pyrfu_0586 [Pyrolobus fumarii 1A]